MNRFVLMLLLCLGASSLACAQDDNVISLTKPITADSVHSSLVPEQHSASKALRLSIIPGGGQIYNKQAWKVPIIYGLLGGLGYLVYTNYQDCKMFKDEYLHRVNNNGECLLEDYASYPDNNIYNLYQTYNQRFQLMIVVSVVVYGLNLLDAYVFGHLFDFQIDDDISMSMSPSLMSTPDMHPVPGIGLSFSL